MFAGAMVAIVTPFKDGVVDETALRELVEFQIAGGTDAIIPLWYNRRVSDLYLIMNTSRLLIL